MLKRLQEMLAKYQVARTRKHEADCLAYAQWALNHHPDVGRRGLYGRTVRAAKLKEHAK